MCNFNILCHADNGQCACRKGTPGTVTLRSIPIPFAIPRTSTLLTAIFRMICQQDHMLKLISESNQRALQRFDRLEARTDQEHSETCITEHQSVTVMDLQRLLCGETTHSHSLQLVNEISNPAYKGRSFSVLLQLVDANGEVA